MLRRGRLPMLGPPQPTWEPTVSDSSIVVFEQHAGIVVLTLNRPEALNALNLAVLQQLAALLDRLRTDAAVHAVILTGGGTRAFCAGADIRQLNSASRCV